MTTAVDLRDQVLSTAQVAEILQCSSKHVSELRKRGVLRAIPHTGRSGRYARREVERFIAGLPVESAQEAS